MALALNFKFLSFLSVMLFFAKIDAKIIGVDLGTGVSFVASKKFWSSVVSQNAVETYQQLLKDQFLGKFLPPQTLETITKDFPQEPFGRTFVEGSRKAFKHTYFNRYLFKISVDGKNVEYSFFKGSGKNENSLIVICPGLSLKQSMVAPQIVQYLIMFNKYMGYNCLYMPYPGHFTTNEPHESLSRRGFDAGIFEAKALVKCIEHLKTKEMFVEFDKTIGFGTCFGAAVLAIAQQSNRPFDSLFLVSPLVESLDILRNVLSKELAFQAISGRTHDESKVRFKKPDIKLANMALKLSVIAEKYGLLSLMLITGAIGAYKNKTLANKTTIACSALSSMILGKLAFSESNIFTKKIIEQASGVRFKNYMKYYMAIDVPTVYLNSVFSLKKSSEKAPQKGDVITTKDTFQELLAAISNKNKKFVTFWSKDVGHLKNWALEGLQFLSICDGFFSDCDLFLNKIQKSFTLA